MYAKHIVRIGEVGVIICKENILLPVVLVLLVLAGEAPGVEGVVRVAGHAAVPHLLALLRLPGDVDQVQGGQV